MYETEKSLKVFDKGLTTRSNVERKISKIVISSNECQILINN